MTSTRSKISQPASQPAKFSDLFSQPTHFQQKKSVERNVEFKMLNEMLNSKMVQKTW
jgi:hypothetical protein